MEPSISSSAPSLSSASRCSWLWRQSLHTKSWARRFYILRDSIIFACKSQPKMIEDGIHSPYSWIQIDESTVLRKENMTNKKNLYVFSLLAYDPEGASFMHFLGAESEQDRELWINAIQNAIDKEKQWNSGQMTSPPLSRANSSVLPAPLNNAVQTAIHTIDSVSRPQEEKEMFTSAANQQLELRFSEMPDSKAAREIEKEKESEIDKVKENQANDHQQWLSLPETRPPSETVVIEPSLEEGLKSLQRAQAQRTSGHNRSLSDLNRTAAEMKTKIAELNASLTEAHQILAKLLEKERTLQSHKSLLTREIQSLKSEKTSINERKENSRRQYVYLNSLVDLRQHERTQFMRWVQDTQERMKSSEVEVILQQAREEAASNPAGSVLTQAEAIEKSNTILNQVKFELNRMKSKRKKSLNAVLSEFNGRKWSKSGGSALASPGPDSDASSSSTDGVDYMDLLQYLEGWRVTAQAWIQNGLDEPKPELTPEKAEIPKSKQPMKEDSDESEDELELFVTGSPPITRNPVGASSVADSHSNFLEVPDSPARRPQIPAISVEEEEKTNNFYVRDVFLCCLLMECEQRMQGNTYLAGIQKLQAQKQRDEFEFSRSLTSLALSSSGAPAQSIGGGITATSSPTSIGRFNYPPSSPQTPSSMAHTPGAYHTPSAGDSSSRHAAAIQSATRKQLKF